MLRGHDWYAWVEPVTGQMPIFAHADCTMTALKEGVQGRGMTRLSSPHGGTRHALALGDKSSEASELEQ